MYFEMSTYSPTVRVDDAEILDQVLKSSRCFVTINRGVFVLEFPLEDKEYRYVTDSHDRFNSICEALRNKGIPIIAGNVAFEFACGLALFILCGLAAFVLVR